MCVVAGASATVTASGGCQMQSTGFSVLVVRRCSLKIAKEICTLCDHVVVSGNDTPQASSLDELVAPLADAPL